LSEQASAVAPYYGCVDTVEPGRWDPFMAEHYGEVLAVAARIAGQVRRTPLLESPELGPGVLLKAENLQVTGSFKARGALNALLRLRAADAGLGGVVAVSSGNHAQAIAWMARLYGMTAVIVMPEGSSPRKLAATRALGAEVVTDGVRIENREEMGRQAAASSGWPLVHPFADWDVIHGQGTVALEVLEDAPGTGVIVTPVGGGGLVSGTAIVAAAAGGARVIGVEPAVADDAARSLRSGRHERLAQAPETIADGVRALAIGGLAFDVIVSRRLVDDVVTVSEPEIAEAVAFAWTRLRLALEPTGALPLAAHLAGRLPAGTPAAPTVLVLTGGNFEPDVVARVLRDRGPAIAAGPALAPGPALIGGEGG
jgi:threonine dehydratase